MRDQSFYLGLEQESKICAQCGYCRVECPVYKNLGWESSSPRAKMRMAGEIASGKSVSDQEALRVFQCTLCGKCREACSTCINTTEVWKYLREKIAKQGKNPDNLKMLASTIQSSSNITGDEQTNREMWIDGLDEAEKCREHIGKQAEVLYFAGCSGSLYPQAYSIPQSFVQILDYAGIDYSMLGEKEGCCGFPLLGAGEIDKGLGLMQANVDNISNLGTKTVVTTCPSCYHTLRDTYPELLGRSLPFEVLHASQYLEQLISEGKLDLKEINDTVTYHDPCDLGRNSGVFDAPRNVIKKIPGIELIEMEKSRENSNCCGGGGNLEAVDADLTAQIAKNRLMEINDTGAKTVISACQQCKRTLQGNARKNKMRIRVMDLCELVLKSLKK